MEGRRFKRTWQEDAPLSFLERHKRRMAGVLVGVGLISVFGMYLDRRHYEQRERHYRCVDALGSFRSTKAFEVEEGRVSDWLIWNAAQEANESCEDFLSHNDKKTLNDIVSEMDRAAFRIRSGFSDLQNWTPQVRSRLAQAPDIPGRRFFGGFLFSVASLLLLYGGDAVRWLRSRQALHREQSRYKSFAELKEWMEKEESKPLLDRHLHEGAVIYFPDGRERFSLFRVDSASKQEDCTYHLRVSSLRKYTFNLPSFTSALQSRSILLDVNHGHLFLMRTVSETVARQYIHCSLKELYDGYSANAYLSRRPMHERAH